MKCWPSPVVCSVVIGGIGLLLINAGCHNVRRAEVDRAQAYPPDFALQFYVQAPASSRDPMTRQAQHILQADRRLRVALGDGVTPETFPPPTRMLTTRQVAKLYRRVAAAALDRSPPASPLVTDSPGITYHIRVTADGHVIDCRRAPDDGPVSAILSLLVVYRGGR